jgi:hypothetical protein
MLAMLSWEQGDKKKARWLFKKAARINVAAAYTWQSWAVLERELGNIGRWPDPDVSAGLR